MTTSGLATFNLDLNEIVEEAFERAGSELRTGYDLRTARRSLNLLFADWANRGINMWTFEQDVITLVTGQPTYALPDDTIDLLEHVIRTNANQPSNQADLTITRISVSTYATIPNKLIQGRPIQVYIQRLTAQNSVLPGTLQATIGAADTSIPVTSMVGIPNAGFITIGSELIFFNVCARRARCPILPGALAAFASLPAGIFCPSFTPSAERRAPGFLIAF